MIPDPSMLHTMPARTNSDAHQPASPRRGATATRRNKTSSQRPQVLSDSTHKVTRQAGHHDLIPLDVDILYDIPSAHPRRGAAGTRPQGAPQSRSAPLPQLLYFTIHLTILSTECLPGTPPPPSPPAPSSYHTLEVECKSAVSSDRNYTGPKRGHGTRVGYK